MESKLAKYQLFAKMCKFTNHPTGHAFCDNKLCTAQVAMVLTATLLTVNNQTAWQQRCGRHVATALASIYEDLVRSLHTFDLRWAQVYPRTLSYHFEIDSGSERRILHLGTHCRCKTWGSQV